MTTTEPRAGTGPSGTGGAGGRGGNDLRRLALTGGLYLTIREAIGMVVRLGGVVVVTRLLGPARYGVYFGTSSFVAVIATAAQMGSEIWLIRQREEPTEARLQEVWTALCVVAGIVTAAGLLLSIPAGLFVDRASILPFRLLILSVPINVLWAPAQARIEREFGYRRMAWLELGGDLTLYGVGVPLALAGLGVYALVIGYLAWQTFLLVGSLLMARFRPRLRWNRDLTMELVRHGLGYSSNDWAQRLAALSMTVVVGSVVGSAGVGVLGLASRLVETVSFGLRATWRLGMATLSRLADDRARLSRAVEQGMLAQTIVLAVPLLVLGLASRWVIPEAFGRVWLPAVAVYAILGVTRLVTSPTQILTTLLYMQGRITAVTRASVAVGVLLWILAVPLTLADGVDGYCYAVLISSVGWIVIDRAARRAATIRYGPTALCALAFLPGLAFPLADGPFRYLLLLPLALVVVVPSLRRSLLGFASTVLAQMRPSADRSDGSTAAGGPAGDPPSRRRGSGGRGPKRVGRRLGIVRRRGLPFVLTFLVVAGGAGAYAMRAAPSYSASSYVVVNSGASAHGPGSAAEADTLAVTYASAIPQDQAVLDAVARLLGVDAGQVSRATSVYAGYQTAVLDLTYRAGSPAEAIRGARALADVVTSPATATSAVSARSLAVVSVPDVATAASGAHKDALALGLLGGLLLGLIVALSLERFSPRVDSVEDLETVLGVPVATLVDLATAGPRVYARRWAELAAEREVDVTLVPASPSLERSVAVLAEELRAAGAAPGLLAMGAPRQAAGMRPAPSAAVMVCSVGDRAREVVRAAEASALFEQEPCWAILVDRSFRRRGPDTRAWPVVTDTPSRRSTGPAGAPPSPGAGPAPAPPHAAASPAKGNPGQRRSAARRNRMEQSGVRDRYRDGGIDDDHDPGEFLDVVFGDPRRPQPRKPPEDTNGARR